MEMKHCPTCNRTYTDESLNFCLADGAFLSAPTDPQPTVASPTARSTESPTEIIPTELLPRNIVTDSPRRSATQESTTVRKTSLLPWFLLGILAVAFVVYLAISKEPAPDNSNTLGASSNNQTPTNISTTVLPDPSLTPQEAPTETVLETRRPNNTNVDPGGIGTGNGIGSSTSTSSNTNNEPPRSDNTNTVSQTEVTEEDYSRTFKPSEVDQKARILARPDPQYTEEARKNQVAGTVVLRAVFSSNGQVTNIRSVSGLPNGLTERAMAAARQIRFTPAMKDGRAVSMYIQIEYNFNLY
jgi:TonB family protein